MNNTVLKEYTKSYLKELVDLIEKNKSKLKEISLLYFEQGLIYTNIQKEEIIELKKQIKKSRKSINEIIKKL